MCDDELRLPEIRRIMLDPSRLGIMLRKGLIDLVDYLPSAVKQ